MRQNPKMGDLYRALGQSEAARGAFGQALAIRERLAAAEPDRADYQRDLLISLLRAVETDAARAKEHRRRGRGIVDALAARGAQIDQLRQAFEEP